MRPRFLMAAALTLSGLNSDPGNPDGAPGPSTITNGDRITR
ncbi:MAG: hypothetical protein ACM3II_02035 [Rhodospirillaceae bacterium]